MSFLRSLPRISPFSKPLLVRANSTASSSTPLGSTSDPSPPPRPRFPNLNFDIPDINISPTAWWTKASNERSGTPGNVYSGRTFAVLRGNDFSPQYKKMQIMISRTGIKHEMKRKEYYEKPSEKRVRLASERHRRRFAHMVREKVHLVQLLRDRA